MSTDAPVPNLSHLPPEMLDFTLSKTFGALAPRLGRLTLPGRKPLLTPDFLGNTSRGAVPHISQDIYRSRANLGGVYIALEDFVEKHPQKIPPVLQYDVPEPLRRFIALPDAALLVLGARRMPPLPTPMSNTNSEVALQTSVGFKTISLEYYAAAARKLQPDIVIGLADIPFGQESVSTKRKDKMSDRTEAWMRDIIAKRNGIDKGERRFNIFAPFLPLDKDLQQWYLEHLVDEMADHISGIAIYDAYLLDDLPEELHKLPRLSLHPPASPQELLRQISLGMDIFTIPFVNEATDAGIALDFTFPAPEPREDTKTSRRSLGIDMWQPEHATSLIPLSTGTSCSCYACSHHHRAYLQHLLNAKEMLGWVLLQLHNHAILSSFFAGVRASISASTFAADVAAFEAYYEPQLPEKTGQGPRVRGYQFRSQDHAKGEKKNPKAYSKDLEGKVKTVKVFAAHGQEPKEKPETRNLIDDEALEGLVDLENLRLEDGNGNGKGELELEDDENGRASSSSS
ncbi:tRNA-guanine transglycosylase [Westerdykella ornata]|uniref:Queuine tRNA-ribosyltransferase accessory subunit 2 n=1 Tax=Westerdykella ornata TaxID=318751 RepID=A0A6A6JIQ4_WESOR|nr:tRNA-guanine transglycosylase [Westerdykella ornata]KAF2276451.1 tRNA-guanine transglycosylase [Westerdykella ornata]